MKNIRRVSILGGLLLILVGLTVTLVASWLTDTSETGSTVFTVGNVKYILTGEMVDSPVVPGQNLIDESYKLDNDSTVKSELRVLITITSSLLGGDATDVVLLTFGDGWEQEGDYWYYRDSLNTVAVTEDETTKYKIDPTVKEIIVLTSIILDGFKVGNTFAGTTFAINLLFQAKQSDFITWEQLGTANINFETGKA